MHPDTFWIIAMIQIAPRYILAHPDDPSDHPDAVPDHRDAVLDARKPSADPQKRRRTDLERRNPAPEPILDPPDRARVHILDTLDVREGAPKCIAMIQNVSRCILNHRDDPKLHRDDPRDIGEDAKTVRDDPKPGREDPGTAREDPKPGLDGPRNVRDDPKSDREDPGMVRDDPKSDRDDPDGQKPRAKWGGPMNGIVQSGGGDVRQPPIRREDELRA
jgi:hypothetical protein